MNVTLTFYEKYLHKIVYRHCSEMSKIDDLLHNSQYQHQHTSPICLTPHNDVSHNIHPPTMQPARKLVSPFSFYAAPFEEVVIPKIDPATIRRRQYCMFNLRISSCIEHTTSLPTIPITANPLENNNKHASKKMFHNDKVGTLMVSRKKPFQVRFK